MISFSRLDSFRRRIVARLSRHPIIGCMMLFYHDCRRFINHAGCLHQEEYSAALARVIMAYHVVEKGLTMPRRHLDFGHEAVLDLMRLIEDFQRRFHNSNVQVDHAIGCVKEYYAVHKQAGFDMSQCVRFWTDVENFCRCHSDVCSASQIEISREEFFANRTSSFPQFAASRHTCRHYEGIIDISRIHAAVDLAILAPSACNRQFTKVYCVSKHSLRDKILDLQNGNRGFGMDADKLLVVTADLRGNRWKEERNDLYTNAGIFIMNLCYALHYNEIVHCILNWSVTTENDARAHELLNISENEVIVALLVCGNAPAHLSIASSPRKSVGELFREIV